MATAYLLKENVTDKSYLPEVTAYNMQVSDSILRGRNKSSLTIHNKTTNSSITTKRTGHSRGNSNRQLKSELKISKL